MSLKHRSLTTAINASEQSPRKPSGFKFFVPSDAGCVNGDTIVSVNGGDQQRYDARDVTNDEEYAAMLEAAALEEDMGLYFCSCVLCERTLLRGSDIGYFRLTNQRTSSPHNPTGTDRTQNLNQGFGNDGVHVQAQIFFISFLQVL